MQDANSENAVFAINKETGDITPVIKGKGNSGRPSIKAFNVHKGTLYLDVDGRGIVKYDGKGVDSSPLIGEVEHGWFSTGIAKPFRLSPNGRYLVYGDENITVYDLQEDNRAIKRCGNQWTNYTVTDAGDLYAVNGYDVAVLRNNGDDKGYEDQGRAGLSSFVKGKALEITQIGDSIFVVGENQIASTVADKFEWKTTTTLNGISMMAANLSAEKLGFAWISLTAASDRFAHFSTTDSKPILEKQMNTGIGIPRYKKGYVIQKADNIHFDSMGNIWMRCEEAGRCLIVVYNPKGIVGLGKLAGRYKEVKP